MLGIPVLRLRGDYLAIVARLRRDHPVVHQLRDFYWWPAGHPADPASAAGRCVRPVSYLSLVYLIMGAGLVAFIVAAETVANWAA